MRWRLVPVEPLKALPIRPTTEPSLSATPRMLCCVFVCSSVCIRCMHVLSISNTLNIQINKPIKKTKPQTHTYPSIEPAKPVSANSHISICIHKSKPKHTQRQHTKLKNSTPPTRRLNKAQVHQATTKQSNQSHHFITHLKQAFLAYLQLGLTLQKLNSKPFEVVSSSLGLPCDSWPQISQIFRC